MQNIFKFDAVNSIRNIRITTQRLARVMRKDSRNRKRDYNQISELNFRLARVIPIIPMNWVLRKQFLVEWSHLVFRFFHHLDFLHQLNHQNHLQDQERHKQIHKQIHKRILQQILQRQRD